MKKRVVAILLTGVMSASLLAGCSDASSAPASASTEAAEESTEAAEEGSTETAEATEDTVAMEFEGRDDYSYSPKWDDYNSLIDEIRVTTDSAS